MPTDVELLLRCLQLLEARAFSPEDQRVCAEMVRSVLRAHGRLGGQ